MTQEKCILVKLIFFSQVFLFTILLKIDTYENYVKDCEVMIAVDLNRS